MKRQLLTMVAVGAMGLAGVARAESGRIRGVIARVTESEFPIIEVTTRAGGFRTIRTDGRTTYVKWLTRAPWQQPKDVVTGDDIARGRCVEVELEPNTRGIAKSVRISDEPAGTLADPCKQQR